MIFVKKTLQQLRAKALIPAVQDQVTLEAAKVKRLDVDQQEDHATGVVDLVIVKDIKFPQEFLDLLQDRLLFVNCIALMANIKILVVVLVVNQKTILHVVATHPRDVDPGNIGIMVVVVASRMIVNHRLHQRVPIIAVACVDLVVGLIGDHVAASKVPLIPTHRLDMGHVLMDKNGTVHTVKQGLQDLDLIRPRRHLGQHHHLLIVNLLHTHRLRHISNKLLHLLLTTNSNRLHLLLPMNSNHPRRHRPILRHLHHLRTKRHLHPRPMNNIHQEYTEWQRAETS